MGRLRTLAKIAALLATLFVATGCTGLIADAISGKKPDGGAEDAATGEATDQEIHDDDASGAGLLADRETAAEAKAYLADTEHNGLWKVSRPAVTQLVDDLYAAGAASVDAVDITDFGGRKVTAIFVVTLPAEAPSRQKVIEAHNAFWKGFLEDADEDDLKSFTTRDVGQKHIVINFDL